MNRQITHTVLMVQPDHFQFNTQTAADNAFQSTHIKDQDVLVSAQREFSDMVNTLRKADINVITLSSPIDITPDAVFPNNWFTTHDENGKRSIIFYPMLAENRRLERQIIQLKNILTNFNFDYANEIDFSSYENKGKYLEGTGSVILDRMNNIAYAAISARTDETILREFAERMNYKTIIFDSYDKNHRPIYHTNVILSIGEEFAVITSESIAHAEQRQRVLNSFKTTNKEIIEISLEQMNHMCGNILQLRNNTGEAKIILSQTAFDAFDVGQKQRLQQHGELVIVKIPTIEAIGGGSARCMLAEIF